MKRLKKNKGELHDFRQNSSENDRRKKLDENNSSLGEQYEEMNFLEIGIE